MSSDDFDNNGDYGGDFAYEGLLAIQAIKVGLITKEASDTRFNGLPSLTKIWLNTPSGWVGQADKSLTLVRCKPESLICR
ncbi:MAG: hypothetical protein H6868_09530 [Rhodospirillales bacterium]|nr:hypothetical protein [Rhodospirillales bacterium]